MVERVWQPVAYQTYVMFAKRYGIPRSRVKLVFGLPKRVLRSMPTLSKAIKAYEKRNHITGGLYY